MSFPDVNAAPSGGYISGHLGARPMIEPTVHVVDDDPSFVRALSRLLRANGFRVQTYSSAEAFLGRERAGDPGCVIADLRMPAMDGLDLQSALRGMPNTLPILFLTGQAETASIVRAMRGGAEDFLEKTAKLEVLFDAVRRALARDEQAREQRNQHQALQARFNSISSREREVLGHILQGRLNKQIASDLGIHERTVKVHRKSIMVKLKIRSVAALARLSQEAGVSIPEQRSPSAMQDEPQPPKASM
jgi:FixJ family two-component response regulator